MGPYSVDILNKASVSDDTDVSPTRQYPKTLSALASIGAADGRHPLCSRSMKDGKITGGHWCVCGAGKQLSEEAGALLCDPASSRPYIFEKLQNLELSCFEWQMQIL